MEEKKEQEKAEQPVFDETEIDPRMIHMRRFADAVADILLERMDRERGGSKRPTQEGDVPEYFKYADLHPAKPGDSAFDMWTQGLDPVRKTEARIILKHLGVSDVENSIHGVAAAWLGHAGLFAKSIGDMSALYREEMDSLERTLEAAPTKIETAVDEATKKITSAQSELVEKRQQNFEKKAGEYFEKHLGDIKKETASHLDSVKKEVQANVAEIKKQLGLDIEDRLLGRKVMRFIGVTVLWLFSLAIVSGLTSRATESENEARHTQAGQMSYAKGYAAGMEAQRNREQNAAWEQKMAQAQNTGKSLGLTFKDPVFYGQDGSVFCNVARLGEPFSSGQADNCRRLGFKTD